MVRPCGMFAVCVDTPKSLVESSVALHSRKPTYLPPHRGASFGRISSSTLLRRMLGQGGGLLRCIGSSLSFLHWAHRNKHRQLGRPRSPITWQRCSFCPKIQSSRTSTPSGVAAFACLRLGVEQPLVLAHAPLQSGIFWIHVAFAFWAFWSYR